MPRIDESRPFIPVRIAVLAVSDTRDQVSDVSGGTLAALIAEAGHVLAERAIVKDDIGQIGAKVEAWIADPQVDVVLDDRRHRLYRPRRDARGGSAAV